MKYTPMTAYTIGLITSTVKKILDFGGKVLLMSATMPEFLKNTFKFTPVLKMP